MFPNVMRVFQILLVFPATSACIERSNSILRYIKNIYRNNMNKLRLNAIILMYDHKYMKLDYDMIINFFATKHTRRMFQIFLEKTE